MEVKIQPHNEEMENAVVGSVLVDPNQFYKVEPYLMEREIWYSSKHKRLWIILEQMTKNGEHIDLKTVSSNFSKTDKKNGLDSYWTTGLTDEIVSPSRCIIYAKKMYEDLLYRKTIKKTAEIQNKAYDGNASVYPLIGETYTMLGELLDLRPSTGFNIDDAMDKTMDEIKEGAGNMVKCGWEKIDKLSGGFTKGEVSIIGGRPGHGKTTFLINIASKLVESGHKVMMFNRELPVTEVVKKLIVLESGVLSYRQVRNSEYNQADADELSRIDKVLRKKYSSEQFQMFDRIADFDTSALEVRKFKPDVVIDDYVQLIKPPKITYDARRLELEKICNDYKWLAKENQCVVILASQLNRALEHRGVRAAKPQLSDLAESGAIEQVAENVFFVHYQWKTHPDKKKNSPHKIELIARKVRYGETGSLMMGYDGDKCKFFGTFKEYEKQFETLKLL